MVKLHGGFRNFKESFTRAERRRVMESKKRNINPRLVANQVEQDFCDALKSGDLSWDDFPSIRGIFESTVDGGREMYQSWMGGSKERPVGVGIHESGVNLSSFSNIINQISFSRVMDEFNKPNLIGDSLVEVIPSDNEWEKLPGMGGIGDQAKAVNEGENYPIASLSEDFVITPETVKYGMIVPVTKEAILFDKTGLVLRRAGQVAEYLAINREKRILDVALGIIDVYNRKNRGVITTYGNDSGTHDFDNLAASNGLVDWTNVEAARLLFEDMTDPNDGEPVMIDAPKLIVPGALLDTAARIVSATEVREVSNTNTTTISANPIAERPEVMSNPYVKLRSGSATTWFYGDPQKAFGYLQNWAAESVQAPTNSHLEFTQDIAVMNKISERGVAFVKDPRYMMKCTA